MNRHWSISKQVDHAFERLFGPRWQQEDNVPRDIEHTYILCADDYVLSIAHGDPAHDDQHQHGQKD